MKKLTHLIVSLTLVACSESGVLSYVPETSSDALASDNRSIEEAAKIANDFLSQENIVSRNGSKTALKANPHIVSSKISRAEDVDTLMYAFDLEDDNGFILIAAPRNVEPIMAVIENGSYKEVYNIENQAFHTTFSLMTNFIYMSSKKEDGLSDVVTNSVDPVNPNSKTTWKIIRNWEPSVEVVWGQRWPECLYTPNWIAGCVPLAIGMALSVFEKPNEITYTFEGKDLDSETLNWHEIKKHKQSSGLYYGCEVCSVSNENTHKTIGRLIREIGKIVGASYSTKPDYSTNTPTGQGVAEAMLKLADLTPDDKRGSRHNTKPGTIDSLYNCLSNNAGVAIVDYGSIKNLSMGHAFIADATQIVRYYYGNTPYITFDDVKMIHYNWGEAGACNGWYNLDAVNPDYFFTLDFPEIENEYCPESDINSLIYWYYKL